MLAKGVQKTVRETLDIFQNNYFLRGEFPLDQMSSKVRVKSNTCGKTSYIEVTMNDKMEFDVKINSDCQNVCRFATFLPPLTMNDLTDKKNGAVIRTYQEQEMSANCLVPAGILTAAWMEAGMLSKNRFRSVERNCVEFVE